MRQCGYTNWLNGQHYDPLVDYIYVNIGFCLNPRWWRDGWIYTYHRFRKITAEITNKGNAASQSTCVDFFLDGKEGEKELVTTKVGPLEPGQKVKVSTFIETSGLTGEQKISMLIRNCQTAESEEQKNIHSVTFTAGVPADAPKGAPKEPKTTTARTRAYPKGVIQDCKVKVVLSDLGWINMMPGPGPRPKDYIMNPKAKGEILLCNPTDKNIAVTSLKGKFFDSRRKSGYSVTLKKKPHKNWHIVPPYGETKIQFEFRARGKFRGRRDSGYIEITLKDDKGGAATLKSNKSTVRYAM